MRKSAGVPQVGCGGSSSTAFLFDVPAITNLVFMRRVRSRILYEQMLGRELSFCVNKRIS